LPHPSPFYLAVTPPPSTIIIVEAAAALTTAVLALRLKGLWFCRTALVSREWKI
jgi:hypothetical protein